MGEIIQKSAKWTREVENINHIEIGKGWMKSVSEAVKIYKSSN